MLFYISISLGVLLISFLTADKRTTNIQKNFSCLFLIIALAFIAGIRLIGYDFSVYQQHFYAVPSLFDYTRTNISIELGYELLVSFFKLFSNSFNGYLFFYAVLTLLMVTIWSYKYSPYPLISLAMFFAFSFFLQMMGQMRQPFGILLAMILLVPLFQKQKYLIAFLVIIGCGYFFHKSLLFCIFLFIFRDKCLPPKVVIVFLGASLCAFIMSKSIFELIMSLIPTNFYLYGVIYDYMYTKGLQFSFSLGMIERCFVFSIIYYIAYKYNLYQKNSLLRLFVNMYLMGVCLYFSFINVAAEFAARGTFFYTYSFFIALPMLIKESPIKIKYFLLTFAFLWSIYLSTAVIRDGGDRYLPYKSLFFNN